MLRKIIIAMLFASFSMNAMAFDLFGTVGAIANEFTRPSTVISIGSATYCAKMEDRTAQRNCAKILGNMQRDMLRKEEDAYRQQQRLAPETVSQSQFNYTVDANGVRRVTETGSITMKGGKRGWNSPYERPNYGTWK